MDILTGRRAAERRAARDRLSLQVDIALDGVKSDADALRKKREAFEGLVDDLKERRRGNNA